MRAVEDCLSSVLREALGKQLPSSCGWRSGPGLESHGSPHVALLLLRLLSCAAGIHRLWLRYIERLSLFPPMSLLRLASSIR
jgi:hypothetical protein